MTDEEKWDVEDQLLEELSILHAHCSTCCKRYCQIKPDGVSSCPIIFCKQGCGASYHECKQSEHEHLCSLERVPCINAAYGCPLMMSRANLGQHLTVCPASVIFCSIEWNRWPVQLKKGLTAQIPLDNPYLRCHQLDVALALRDQRMLIDLLKSSCKMQNISRNSHLFNNSGSCDSDNLNRGDTSKTILDEKTGIPWNLTKSPPGLESNICNKLFRATKQTMDSLTIALDSVSSHLELAVAERAADSKPVSHVDRKFVLPEIVCTWCKHRLSSTSKCENSNSNQADCLNSSCSSHKEHFSSLGTSLASNSETVESNHKPSMQTMNSDSVQLLTDENSTDIQNNSGCIKLNQLLGIALNMECMARYQPKPKYIFTFLCAQEFRRDEYAWHYKNVHNDIHCGLNGWLEQRCPLAYLGCTFSFHRFYPSKPELKIIHSSVVESFGVAKTDIKPTNVIHPVKTIPARNDLFTKKTAASGVSQRSTPEIITSCQYESLIQVVCKDNSQNITTSENTDFFTLLPFEVLQLILLHADGFSLCNLALTCKRLRDVCTSLLEERGLVTQVWEKQASGSQHGWKVAYKKWRFSTSLTPINFWGFHGPNSLSEHLKVCPYNQDVTVHTEPFELPMDEYSEAFHSTKRVQQLRKVWSQKSRPTPPDS